MGKRFKAIGIAVIAIAIFFGGMLAQRLINGKTAIKSGDNTSSANMVLETSDVPQQALTNTTVSQAPVNTPKPSARHESVDGPVGIAMKNALLQAEDYISNYAFSYQKTIEWLEDDGYTHEEAVYAAENCGADWDAEALEKAKDYISSYCFSYKKLVRWLTDEGFTEEQAIYAANSCEADWNAEAVEQAEDYLSYSFFSYKKLLEWLEDEDYSPEQALYAVESLNIDWNEQAAGKAAEYMEHSVFSKSKLIEWLEDDGFTNEQAIYGAEANGY